MNYEIRAVKLSFILVFSFIFSSIGAITLRILSCISNAGRGILIFKEYMAFYRILNKTDTDRENVGRLALRSQK